MSRFDDFLIENGADPGEIIGYRTDGRPIYLPGGSARNTFEAWIPEEFDSSVIQRVNQVSAVEANASRIPMGSTTKSVPRSAGMSVDYTSKGVAYGEDVSTNDDVVLTARKFTKAIRIADEDLSDSLASIIATKQRDWATSYGKFVDNASLGVTATVGAGVPFNSVYYALSQTNANTSYTGNANITKSGTAAPTYDGLNTATGLLETGDYWDESRVLIIAHPSYRRTLRGIKDTQGDPIFRDSTNADIHAGPTLFGNRIAWSLGSKTSPTATSNPAGNPLLVFCNLDYLLLGIRSGPESAYAPADSGVGFLTDEALLKMRSRRGFNVGHEAAFSIYENNSGS